MERGELDNNDNDNNFIYKQFEQNIQKLEDILKNCKIKFKFKSDIDLVYKNFTNFLINENYSETHLFEKIEQYENSLKIKNRLSDTIQKKLNSLKEQLKCLNIEIKSVKTMLEKSLNSWTKYNDLYSTLDIWLDKQEHVNSFDINGILDYQNYQKSHTQINELTSFLLQISDQDACNSLKEKLLLINKKWKNMQDKFKQNENKTLLKLIECEQGVVNINEWIGNINQLIERTSKCSINALIRYQEELQKANTDLERIDANLNLISKLASRIDINDKSKIDSLVRETKELEKKIKALRELIPEYCTNLTKLCSVITSAEDGLQEIDHWINEGEILLNSQPELLNFEQITKHIDKQKKHFNEFSYYENIIDTKTQTLESFAKIIPPNIDLSDINSKLNLSREQLSNLHKKCKTWEESFKKHQTSWKLFYNHTKQLEEWIRKAQEIVSEINLDVNYLIQKHKDFFDNIDDQKLHGFLQAGQNLLHIKNEQDKEEIQTLMETLESKWHMILAHAPIRLLKLNFTRLETLLRQEISAADAEIMEESMALNQNKDISEIIKRHEAKFKYSNFFSTCETYLQGLRSCTNALLDQKMVEDKSTILDTNDKIQKYWETLTKKIETMSNRLKALPDLKEKFDKEIYQLNAWLTDFEQNKRNLNNNDLSIGEYKKILERFNSSYSEMGEKRAQVDQLKLDLNTLITQYPIDEKYIQQLVKIEDRFEVLIKNIGFLKERAECIQIALNVSESSDQIANEVREIVTQNTRKFLAEEDECSIEVAINEQRQVINKMNEHQTKINDINKDLKRKNLMARLPSATLEKLSVAQESLKQSINEELDRMSSLLQIQRTDEEKKSKLNTLNANLHQIETILNKEDYEIKETKAGERPRSVLEERIFTDDIESAEYVSRLEMGKSLLNYSKQLISELKQPSLGNGNQLPASRTSTPSPHDYHEMRDIEMKLDAYEHEIDIKLSDIQENAAKHKRLREQIEEIDKRLAILKDEQNSTTSVLFQLDQVDLSTLDSKYNETKNEYNEIIELNNQVLNLYNQSGDLIDLDALKIIPNVIPSNALKQRYELGEKLSRVKAELKQIDVKYASKMNEIREKIDEKKTQEAKKLNAYLNETPKADLEPMIEKLKDLQEQHKKQQEKKIEKQKALLDKVLLDSTNEQTEHQKTARELSSASQNEIINEMDSDISDLKTEYNEKSEQIKTEFEVSYEVNQSKKISNEEIDSFEKQRQIEFDKLEEARLKQIEVELETRRLLIEKDEKELQIRLELEELERKKEEERRIIEEMRRAKENEEKERIKCLEAELEAKRLQQVNEEKQRLAKIEAEIEEKRNKLEKEEKERLLRIEVELKEKKIQQEKEEQERQARLERELEEKRVKLELEEKERLRNLELELERKRKEFELQEKQRIEVLESQLKFQKEQIEKELEDKRIRLELEEKQRIEKINKELEEEKRLAKIREELEAKQSEIKEQELAIKKQLEYEAEQRRIKLEFEEKERFEQLENEIRNKFIEQEKKENEKFARIQFEIEARQKAIEAEEKERKSKIELELEQSRLKLQRDYEEKLRILKQDEERIRQENQKAEEERLRMLQFEEKEREKLKKLEEEEYRKRLEQEEFKRLEKLKAEENEFRAKLEAELAEQKKRLELEIAENIKRLKKEEEERLNRLKQEEEKRHKEAKELEKKRLEFEELEKERLKKLEHEELERLRLIRLKEEQLNEQIKLKEAQVLKEEQEKKLALEKLEQERKKKLELEQEEEERKKVQKLKQNEQIKNLCDSFNEVKLKLSNKDVSSKTLDEQLLISAECERELNSLNAEILKLQTNEFSIESTTQIDLVKSFSRFLASQLEDRQKELIKKQNAKIELKEVEISLEHYIDLARKNIVENPYAQNLNDLVEKIKSNHQIGDSISNCLIKLNDLHNTNQFHETEKSQIDIINVRNNVLNPLLSNISKLEHIERQWKEFEDEFNKVKNFLTYEIESDYILTSKTNLVSEFNSELRKYSKIRTIFIQKVPLMIEIIDKGLELFNQISAPKMSKNLQDTKEKIQEIQIVLDEKCQLLSIANSKDVEIEKFESELNKLKNEFYTIELNVSQDDLSINCIRECSEKLLNIKRTLNQLEEVQELSQKDIDESLNITSNVQIYDNFTNRMKKLDDSSKILAKQIEMLEVKLQKEIMKNLPSRNALIELSDWVKIKYRFVEQLSDSIKPEGSTLDQIKLYLKELQSISNEMETKEVTLRFIRESIENETQQGFYDLVICEKNSKLEDDWNRLKHFISSELERVDLIFDKINTFEKEVNEIESWIGDQKEKTLKQIEQEMITKPEEFQIQTASSQIFSSQISSQKLNLEQIQKSHKDELDNKHDDLKYVSIAKNYIEKKVDYLKSDLEMLEKQSEASKEAKFIKIKHTYENHINELDSNIKREVNFLNNGKLLTRQQYENSINNLKETQKQLEEVHNEMMTTLNTSLDSSSKEKLPSIEETRRITEEITNFAEVDLLPVWQTYEEMCKKIEIQLNQTHANILQADSQLEKNLEVIDYEKSSFEDFIKNIDLNNQLESICSLDKHAKHLIEKVPNITTKQQITQNLECIHEQHDNLCNLVQHLHAKYQESLLENEYYQDLLENTNLIKEEIEEILKIDESLFNGDSTKIKSFLNSIKDAESRLKGNLERFKSLNISDTKRMEAILEAISSSDDLLKQLHVKQSKLLGFVNEKKYRMQSKLNEIALFLVMYENRRNEFASIDVESCRLNLGPYVLILNDINANFGHLNKLDKELDEFLQAKLNDYSTNYDNNLSINERLEDEQDFAEIKNLKAKIHYLCRQHLAIQTCGFLNNFNELKELVDRLKNLKMIHTNDESQNKEKNLQLKLLLSRFVELKLSLLENIESMKTENLNFISETQLTRILDYVEKGFNETLKETESLIDKLHKYRILALKLESELIEMEGKLIDHEGLGHELSDLENILTYYSNMKANLTSNEFKFNLELICKLGCEIDAQRKIRLSLVSIPTKDSELLKTFDYLPNYEFLRIKYLDLIYRIEMRMKQLESEFTNWKFIAKKASRLLDGIKIIHQLLGALTSKVGEYDRNKHDVTKNFDNNRFKNEADLNSILGTLRRDVKSKINDYERLKDEIVSLSNKANVKSRAIKDIVDKIVEEWKLLCERFNRKLKKIETYKLKVAELDSNLATLRREIFVLETYLNRDCFSQLKLENYNEISAKKNELEELLTRLYGQDESVVELLNYCFVNVRNKKLVKNLYDRWRDLKHIVKQRILEIQNLWLIVCDLNEQIEKFSLILGKTQNFYKNTLVRMVDRDSNIMQFIEELYMTIREDDKLLKYLNESYISLSKLTTNFITFRRTETFRKNILFLNAKWDDLHNEIAIKLKQTRKQEILLNEYDVTKETFILWLNEINLLLTNLEYLSTQELQLKYNDIQDLKREICFQADNILQLDKSFSFNESFGLLIERLKDILRRITRLDSYVSKLMFNQNPKYDYETKIPVYSSSQRIYSTIA